MKTKIHRICSCGCGRVTNPGKRWVIGHNNSYKRSKETRLKMSLAAQNLPKETRLKISLSKIKYNPDYEYCDEWKDEEYKKDLKKRYCENLDCKEDYNQLTNHHINLNKKDCRPCNIMTLCRNCHASLHGKLGHKKIVNPKNYLIIIRANRIVYIHKKTRKKITLRRKKEWIQIQKIQD